MQKSSITTTAELARVIPINPKSVDEVIRHYPMKISSYYLSLIQEKDDPIWKQAVPDVRELQDSRLIDDPLTEEGQSPVPNLIHRYPDRVVFLVSDRCAMYCRYCMRKRKVGQTAFTADRFLEQGIAYIADRPQIQDVILSGGDPLLLTDSRLAQIIREIRTINHVQVIRIHTRVPVTLPGRITPDLAEMLRHYHPLYLNTHFNHPREITPESEKACAILTDAGIPLGCQTVLLKGVNDSPPVMRKLMKELVRIRVKPYYIHHPDPVRGTAHFRPSIRTGLKIMRSLQGAVSGICIPRYMIDLPKGGGKVPLQPEYIEKLTATHLAVRNFAGDCFRYPL